jgi:hypothetical protein
VRVSNQQKVEEAPRKCILEMKHRSRKALGGIVGNPWKCPARNFPDTRFEESARLIVKNRRRSCVCNTCVNTAIPQSGAFCVCIKINNLPVFNIAQKFESPFRHHFHVDLEFRRAEKSLAGSCPDSLNEQRPRS